MIKLAELKSFLGLTKIMLVLMLISCSKGTTNEQLKKSEYQERDTVSQNSILELLVDTDTNDGKIESKKVEIIDEQVETVIDFSFQKCDIELVAYVWKNSETIDQLLIEQFLYTFGEECKNNAEFSGFSNKVLFKVLNSQPNDFLQVLSSSKIDADYILKELEQPIYDAINLSDLHAKLSVLNQDNNVKKRVLEALQTAINKY